jgi:hypothetical protein
MLPGGSLRAPEHRRWEGSPGTQEQDREEEQGRHDNAADGKYGEPGRGEARSWIFCSQWLSQRGSEPGSEPADCVRADGAEELTSTDFGSLCQRGLPLRDSDSYDCGKRPFSLRCHPVKPAFPSRAVGRSRPPHSATGTCYPSCAKASRSFCSCSSGRLVEMISKS